jgi:DNA-directed RNA polymerase subunit beta'
VVDQIKYLGFHYATVSGLTMAISDIFIPTAKARVLEETDKEIEEIDRQYRRGWITEQEQYEKNVEAWSHAMSAVEDAVKKELDPYGPVYMMAQSGAAKGSFQQIRQIAGMRGLMADPSGRIIELPIRSNFREGLNVHGRLWVPDPSSDRRGPGRHRTRRGLWYDPGRPGATARRADGGDQSHQPHPRP